MDEVEDYFRWSFIWVLSGFYFQGFLGSFRIFPVLACLDCVRGFILVGWVSLGVFMAQRLARGFVAFVGYGRVEG